MSRLAYFFKFSVLPSRRAFPNNPDWESEARLVAGHMIAGTDDEYFEMIERECYGE